MEIVLLRHGKPDMPVWDRIKPVDLHKWIASYNSSGIDGDYPSTKAAIQIANRCNAVVCSDFPRSIQSAASLGITKPLEIEPVYREFDLPYSNWQIPKLPPHLWAVLFRALWLLGYSKNGESLKNAKKRSINCADRLISLSKEYTSVMLVGHGFTNRFIAKELLSLGWHGPNMPGNKYWEFGVYKG